MFVSKWEMETKSIRRQEVRQTTYSTAIIEDEKIFQIQTYGAEGSTASVKQVIQFDRERAIELIEIMKREFNI